MTSDGRLNITPRELTFFASGCRVRSVRGTAAKAWSVRASCQDEDGSPPVATRINLRLTPDGALSVSSTGQSYQRCAKPMPVR